MPDFPAAMLGIAIMAVATYLTRIAGYFLGSRVSQNSLASRVLESLPGAALAGVLALSLTHASAFELLAVVVTAAVFLLGGGTLPAIGAGLLLTVSYAHLLG